MSADRKQRTFQVKGISPETVFILMCELYGEFLPYYPEAGSGSDHIWSHQTFLLVNFVE